jgi:hypothetical protein
MLHLTRKRFQRSHWLDIRRRLFTLEQERYADEHRLRTLTREQHLHEQAQCSLGGFDRVAVGRCTKAGPQVRLVGKILRGVVDIGLTIPGLMVLITLAMNVKGGLSIPQMIGVVAVLAWLFPARVIRAIFVLRLAVGSLADRCCQIAFLL